MYTKIQTNKLERLAPYSKESRQLMAGAMRGFRKSVRQMQGHSRGERRYMERMYYIGLMRGASIGEMSCYENRCIVATGQLETIDDRRN